MKQTKKEKTLRRNTICGLSFYDNVVALFVSSFTTFIFIHRQDRRRITLLTVIFRKKAKENLPTCARESNKK